MKKLIMKGSTLLVIGYLSSLFVVKIWHEIIFLFNMFGDRYQFMVKGIECMTCMAIIGIAVMILVVIKMLKWLFIEGKERVIVEEKKGATLSIENQS